MIAFANVLLLLLLLLQVTTTVVAYHRSPCNTAATKADFSFANCYVPPQNPDLLLSSASFLLSHNAATGYIHANSLSKAGLSWWYSKNQAGTAYQQLNDGARALDLRPAVINGTVIFNHGEVYIPISFEALVRDAVKWCKDNPEELVLLLPSHFSFSSSDEKSLMLSEMSRVYTQYGITYFNCAGVYGLTVGEVKELSQLPTGGYLVAIDGQDGYTSCVKENWVEDQLVTCYDSQLNVSCKTSSEPFQKRLTPYMMASANNEATNYAYVLGPPASLYKYPFFEIQALWQVDTHAVVSGMRRVSSILEDNRASHINADVVDLVYSGTAFDSISLLAVDNVALHGNALLSVLRNTCGQSIHENSNGDESVACGLDVPKPRMTYWHVTLKQTAFALVFLYAVTSIGVYAWKRHQQQKQYHSSLNEGGEQQPTGRLWNTLVERMTSIPFVREKTRTPYEEDPVISARREKLLVAC